MRIPSRFSIQFIHTCYTSIKSYIKPIRGYLHHGVRRTVCPHSKIITSCLRGQTKVKEGDRFVQSDVSKRYCVIPSLGESPVGSQGNLIFNNPLVERLSFNIFLVYLNTSFSYKCTNLVRLLGKIKEVPFSYTEILFYCK